MVTRAIFFLSHLHACFWIVSVHVHFQYCVYSGCELQIDCSASEGIPVSDYIVVAILLFLSAMFSGLTLGLMSLDLIGLEIVVKAGSSPDATESMKNDSEYAKKIAPIRKHGNLLLCTLLLGNVFVNSLNAIYLGKMFSGAVGAILATGLITIFGEIVPQALFQRHALCVPLTLTFLNVFVVVHSLFYFQCANNPSNSLSYRYLGSRPVVIIIVKIFIFVTYVPAHARCRRRAPRQHSLPHCLTQRMTFVL